MTVFVQAKSLPITQALRKFIQEQASKIVKFSGKVSQISVYLEKASFRKNNDPLVASVKYHVKMPGKDIVVTRRATDMYDAIVDATDRVSRQVRKFKERRLTLKRKAQN
jgi:putative sigma-54 modulation protein